MNKTADPLSLIPAQNFKAANSGKFAPKLTEDDRCAVLALVQAGVKRDVVARAFDVDRRTVGHICNTNGLRYKPTRQRYVAEGHEEFIKKYVTEEVALKVAAVSDPAKVEAAKTRSPSGRANRMAGEHKVKPEQCQYEHRIEIRFLNETVEEGSKVGWHYRDIDSDPDAWLHNGDASLMTSQACYEAVLENLMDD